MCCTYNIQGNKRYPIAESRTSLLPISWLTLPSLEAAVVWTTYSVLGLISARVRHMNDLEHLTALLRAWSCA